MGNTEYFHRYMPESPKGREIERLTGDGGEIVSRGSAIESLGERMQQAANTLKLIAEGQVGKGDSLDAIKDQAADVHADLLKAGQRYLPSGEVLRAYGQALLNVKGPLNSAVDDCESRWETVRTRASSVDEAGDVPAGEDGSTTAREEATTSAEGDLTSAKSEWEEAARRFDGHYDTWDEAYETAVNGLQQANEDGVKDGFWDNALPFFEALVKVMEWAGLVLLVAALIVGGPLIAVLATIVAIVALLGTIVLFAKGRKDGKDLALSIVGVIPFGKLAKLGNLSSIASVGSRVPKLSGFRNMMLAGDDFAKLRTHLGSIDDLARGDWNRVTTMIPYDAATSGSRLMQRIASGTPYVLDQMTVTRSMDTFLGRLYGVGDSWSAVQGVDRLLPGAQVYSTAMQQLDWLNGKFEDAARERAVDSWR